MRKFESAQSTIPRIRSYFFAPESSVLWNSLSRHAVGKFPDWWNHRLFFGVIPWLGLIAGFYLLFKRSILKENRMLITFMLLSVFFSVIFCLNFNGVSLYKLIFNLPGFSSMRSIDRIINLEVLLFIILFVFSFNEIQKLTPKFKYIVFALPVLVVVDNLFDPSQVKRFDKNLSQERIRAVKKNIIDQYNPKFAAIAYLPFLTHVDNESDGYLNTVATQLDVMSAAQELNIPCVNSYTGFDPGNYLDLFFEPRDKTLQNWCAFNNYDYSTIQIINDIGKKEVRREKINLMAYNNKYVTAVERNEPLIYADRAVASSWENFIVVIFKNEDCFIKASTNLLWQAQMDHDGILSAVASKPAQWETFQLIAQSDSTVAIKASNGLYLSVDTLSFKVYANSPSIGRPEIFKIIKL